MGIALITKDYENTVGKQRMPVIVEFYASWCPKCGMMYPVVERIASRYQGKWIFYKIDIDISKEIAEYIGIEIVPTFVVYRDGKICGYTTGVLPEETLEERIRNVKKIIGGINYSYDEYFAQIALTCYVKIRIQQHRMAEDRNQMNMVFHHIPVSLLYILPGGLFRFRHTAIHHCSVPGGTVCRVVRRHGTPVVRSV